MVILKKNKYNAKTSFHNGISYDSKLEASYAVELDKQLIDNKIKSWRRQEKISLDVNGVHIGNYYIDFVATHHDGHEEYIEVKGFKTEVWLMKWRLAKALYPNRLFTLVT